jgi:type I restriction enzyme S subunit
MERIPDNWREVSLSDLVMCQGGSAFSPALQGRKSGQIPFFKVSDMNLPQNRWLMREANNYVTDADRKHITGAAKPAGSVIFPKVGATIFTNKKRLLLQPSFIDNNVMAVWSKDPAQCLPQYLYLYFLTVSLAELCNPGPLPSINNSKVYERTMLLPPVSEQAKVSAVVWKVHHAIEIEEELVAAAHELKKSVMHQLFTSGLRDEPQKETDIGRMPESWEVLELFRAYETQLGKMLSQKARRGDTPKPYLRNRNVQWGFIDVSDMAFMDFDDKEIVKFRLRPGDLLICEGGVIGRAAIWNGEMEECYYQKALHRVRPLDSESTNEFLAYWLMFAFDVANIYRLGGASSTIAHLPEAQLKALPIPRPSLNEQHEIAGILQTIDRKISVHERKRDTLRELSKSLLHQLMTGQIRVDKLDIDVSEVQVEKDSARVG